MRGDADDPIPLDDDEEPLPRRKRRRDEDEEDTEEDEPKRLNPYILGGIGFAGLVMVFVVWGLLTLIAPRVQKEAKEEKRQEPIAATTEPERKLELPERKAEPPVEKKEILEPLVVGIEVLRSDYRRNPAAADLKYKGKLIRTTLSGKLKQRSGETSLVLDGKYLEYEKAFDKNVEVSFGNSSVVATLEPGRSYTIEGLCEGMPYGAIHITKSKVIDSP